ncbi:MAG: hypothetical protein KC420_01470 [Myxococcales bacterium]|nr:hypothetical protein [Myxococcales bacterium]MCB9568661.1 hypothetical protein [Myxococcales bacterium]MCB9705966.1 hypothetical protein [Myxococcales bacterium]
MGVADKTMFEIYRERDYNRAFHYILYTTLEEHARNQAIAQAASGETVFHGFVADSHLQAAQAELEAIVDELNEMDEESAGIAEDELRRRLGDYLIQ